VFLVYFLWLLCVWLLQCTVMLKVKHWILMFDFCVSDLKRFRFRR